MGGRKSKRKILCEERIGSWENGRQIWRGEKGKMGGRYGRGRRETWVVDMEGGEEDNTHLIMGVQISCHELAKAERERHRRYHQRHYAWVQEPAAPHARQHC
jgi:hypothetical protein